MSYANRAAQTGGNQRQKAKQKAQNRKGGRADAGGSAATPPPGGAVRTTAPSRTLEQPGASGYSYGTVPGQLINQSLGGLTEWMNKYGKDNETVAGLGHGTFADIFRTQANTGLAIQYNDAFLGSLGNYQAGLENLKTGNTSRLMAQEGAIADRMIGRQGEEQRAGYRTLGEQERLTQGDKTNQELRLRADARGAIRSQGARFYG
jgi:hypothetical protein